jgi:hypothetical protein
MLLIPIVNKLSQNYISETLFTFSLSYWLSKSKYWIDINRKRFELNICIASKGQRHRKFDFRIHKFTN